MVKTLSSTPAKRGRRMAVYATSWGEQIPGLLHLADGRWRISGADQQTFTERDERLAVAKFRAIESQQTGHFVPVQRVEVGATESIKTASKRIGDKVSIIVGPKGETAIERAIPAAEYYARVRWDILNEPKKLAQMVGIEQLGWLTDLKPPTESPALQELIDLYAVKPGLSSNEASRSKLFWKEFIAAVGVGTVRELNHDIVGKYEKKILTAGYAPKSVLHRYRKIRTILAYAIERGKGIADCRAALDATAMLKVKNANPTDPRPIAVTDFWKVYNAADKAGDATFAAMLLMSLNCAMYGGEVAALLWEEIDLKAGTLATRRPKTGVSRIAILWPETIRALKALPHNGDLVFYQPGGTPWHVNAVLDKWREYRDAVKVTAVHSQLRDAAFSIASSISTDQAKFLSGHKMAGATDAYLKRNAKLVAPACKAIHDEFFKPRKGRAA